LRERLTLNNVPLVVYFTDRPVREVNHMSLKKFISIWDEGVDSFKKDPPSAELAIYDENGDKHAVLILTKPEVHGDTISFQVNVLDESIPEFFGHSTLFIDPLGVMFPSNQN